MSVIGLAARHQALLYELSQSFSRFIELDRLLPVVIAKSKDALGFESSAVLLVDEGTGELYFPYVADVNPQIESRFRELRIASGRGIVGSVLESGKTEYTPDVRRDQRWYPGVDEQTGLTTRSLLCVPLRTEDRIVGVLQLRNKLAGDCGEEDLEIAEALAGIVAVAISNARRYGEAVESLEHLREETAVLQREVARQRGFGEIVGSSESMRHVFQLMESAVTAPITVLVQGETGTGKELIARAIHSHGPRKNRPFIAVNCGAVSESLLASELFGHKKGAFTGADADRKGLFEVADGGTVFLDEVVETPQTMQTGLLRVLQEREVVRVGETQPRRVDVRIISASNRELRKAVAEGKFREDLFYRLSAFPIAVPPLRERREDVPLLAARLVERTAKTFDKDVRGISRAALDALVNHDWPGNIRELQNEIERAVVLVGNGEAIQVEHLSGRAAVQPIVSAAATEVGTADMTLRQARDVFEEQYITRVLDRHAGNATRAAEALGMSRVMLQNKIRQYGLREKKRVSVP